MPQLVKNFRAGGCTPGFFFVLSDRFLISAKAGVRETQVIVAKGNIGIQPQGGLKLFESLQSAIGILISASQKNMGQRMRRLELYGLFQRSRRRRILALSEQYQCEVKLDIKLSRSQLLRAL